MYGGVTIDGVVNLFVELVRRGDVRGEREELGSEGIESRGESVLLHEVPGWRRSSRKWRTSSMREVLMRARR